MSLFPRRIETQGLCLRPALAGDARRVFEGYAGDLTVLRYLNWHPHESVKQTRNQLSFDAHRWLKGSAWVWMLAPLDDEANVFGQVELLPMSFPSEEAHHLRLGYLMAASHWGRGHMREAVSAVLDAAFAQPQVWRVDALCDVENEASARLMERLGMQREGLMRRAARHPNVSDEPRDVWVYARVRA
jgi:[ribosomal protein S5]-alanine N-acetyltransferase